MESDSALKHLHKMSEYEFAEFFTGLMDWVKEDPLENFVRHKYFMDFNPTPAQTVALKCVFGQSLDTITPHFVWMETTDANGIFALEKVAMTEVEIFQFMTDQEYMPQYQTKRNRINLIVGRRGGKTTISAMLALFCAIKTNWRPFLTKTPAATVAILSHSREFSDEVLDIIRLFVEESPILSKLIDKSKKNTQSTFNLKIPFLVPAKTTKTGFKIQYSRVTIKVGAASKKTTRGRALCALLCDEIAYWNLDEGAAERDEDILRAARPSLLQFREHGLLIKLSSPGIKQGVLYNEWLKRHELPESYLTLKAPSWVWNTILMEKEFREEYLIDPTGFDAEYRANFVDAISNFIMPEYVDLCTIKGQTWLPPEGPGEDIIYSAALDAAFKGDRFAFTLLGWDGTKVKQYVMKTWKGNREKPVQSREVAKYIRTICKEFRVGRVHADQYAFQPLREIFEQYGITLVENPFNNTFKKQIYFNLRKLVHNQGIDLLDHEICTSEMKQLQVEQTTTGTVRIGHPPGGTDDCSDATAIAAYLLAENMNALGVTQAEIAGAMDYGVRVDKSGRAFDAPTATMLGQYYGYEIVDNSHEWVQDEEGEWKHVTEVDGEELDGGNEDGCDFLF